MGEARLDKLPHISMGGFSKDCVVSFLHFLYKGFVVLENFNIQQEFLGLCRSLKVNPPVAKYGGATAVPKQVVEHNPAFSDLSDDDMVIEEVEEAQESVLDEEQQTASAKVQEPESDALLEVEKDTNSNLLIREPQMSEKDHFVETDGIPASVPSVSDSEKKSVKVRQDVAKNVSKVASDVLNNVQKSSTVSSQNVETIPSSSVPDPELGPICDNLEHLVNNNSPPAYESLANLVTPTEDEYDDETTEHISDFLNLLNTKSLNEKKAQEEKDIEEEEEEESFDTFKMPDSFDIPQDYIKEIVPYSSASATPFQVSDEEIEKKFTEIAKPATLVPDLNIVKEEKRAEEVLATEKQDKKVVRNLNFDDDIFKEEFIDNTPVQDEIEQITYKKDESSRRFRDSNKPKQKKVHNPKKDRRKMISSLFSDSDGDLPSTSSKKLSFKDNKEPRAVTPSSEESRTPTPTTSLRSELEEKKERMKKKLKRSGGDVEDPRLLEYKKKKKQMQESTPRKSHSSGSTPSKVHTCNSSCMCVKNIRQEEDNKWLVPDTYESSDEQIGKHSESDESTDNAKPDQSSSQKKKKIHKKRIIPAEDSSDEESDEEENAEDRRKRLDDRKKRKGGDVLAWMSRKARVSVSVQTKPKAVILDMALYKMQLLAEDGTDVSDTEVKQATGKPSDSGSEDSIPRGKRFSPIKVPESEEEVKRTKKKLKKHKKKRKRIRAATPEPTFPVEDVVWTPAMYE